MASYLGTSCRRCIQWFKPSYIKRFSTSANEKRGLVLGVYKNEKESGSDLIDLLTPAAKEFNDVTSGKLIEHLKISGGDKLNSGNYRIFYNLANEFPIVSVVGLGKATAGFNELEERDEAKEDIRGAACAGCRSLQDLGVTHISLESLGNAECAAEGATLGMWIYQEWKNKAKQKLPCIIQLHGDSDKKTVSAWKRGKTLADAQNIARRLTDAPANLMTPTIFALNTFEYLIPLGVDVIERNKQWAEDMGMGSFLSVTRGTDEPPLFIEINYRGIPDNVRPIVLIGKGVTFDAGGISLKGALSMDEMRGDMGGAACVVATIQAAAKLELPINVVGLIPLCENMPSGTATKPGDVVRAMNGKSIQIDNTDAEGRLILADALCYAQQFDPFFTLDIATLTGAIRVALSGSATGVFTNSTNLWNQLQAAGGKTGDRVWRLPLWKYFTNHVTKFSAVDLNNVGKGKGGGSCTAAAFLSEFAPKGDWMHLDIAGVMGPDQTHAYLHKGMTGRPTRTLIEFIAGQAGKQTKM